jgi:hypothetical protein
MEVKVKTLTLNKDYPKEAAKIVGKFPAPGHAIQTIDSDTTAIAPDGKVVAVLLRNAIPRRLYKRAYKILKKIKDRPSNRPAAMGTHSLHRELRSDKRLSRRFGVNEHVLKVNKAREGRLGFDRRGKKTALTISHPEMLHKNKGLIQFVDSLYLKSMPNVYAKQRAVMEKVPHFRLYKTSFTSLYVTKNFRTAYHRDSNNLDNVVTALTPLGKFKGGELVLPRFRIAIAFKPGDLLLFDPHQVHGNLLFKGKRLSVAFYCGGWAAKCGL